MTGFGPEIGAIRPLVRQHAQDAAFLWMRRAQEIDGPTFGETDLGRLDQRLDANLEGLLAAGSAGWTLAREEAETWNGAGEWFAWAVLAAQMEDPAALAAVVDRALAAGAAADRGLSAAAAWVDPARLGRVVRGWLVASEPRLRWLGTAALSHHRVDPGPRLIDLLDDPDPRVRARAQRLTGEVGRRDALPRLREALAASREAAGALALLGEAAGARALLGRVRAEPDAAWAGPALDLALLAIGAEAPPALTELLRWPATVALAVGRAGVLGDAGLRPWLVDRMRDPATAAAAVLAFRDLHAVDVNDTDLFTTRPETLGPAFAGLDPQPLPVADRVAAWPGPAEGSPPFRSLRALRLDALRAALAEPGRPLAPWRRRRHVPAWI